MFSPSIRLAFLILFTTCSASFAAAELILSFSDDGGQTFSNAFDTSVGENVTIGIYIQETQPDTLLSSAGLISFGMEVSSSPAQVGSILSATPDERFDLMNHDSMTSSNFQWEYADTDPVTNTSSVLRLGSFDYQATSMGVSNFAVRDRLVGSGIGNASWLTPNLDVLDEQIFGSGAGGSYSFSISTTAIPEPDAAFACFLGAMLLVRRRRRRRR